MKRLVNGLEVDLPESAAEVVQLEDRLLIRTPSGASSALAVRVGDDVHVSYKGRTYLVERPTRAKSQKAGGNGEIKAPMPGLIVDVLVSEGQSVQTGDKLVVLEAMKTQQAFTAPFDGRVSSVKVSKAQQVKDSDLLVLVVPVEPQ